MSNKIVTFKEFIASRKYVTKIEDHVTGGIDGICPGFVYMGEYYIVDNAGKEDAWELALFNESITSNDLGHLERILYDYAAGASGWLMKRVTITLELEVPASKGKKDLDGLLDYIKGAAEETCEIMEAPVVIAAGWRIVE